MARPEAAPVNPTLLRDAQAIKRQEFTSAGTDLLMMSTGERLKLRQESNALAAEFQTKVSQFGKIGNLSRRGLISEEDLKVIRDTDGTVIKVIADREKLAQKDYFKSNASDLDLVASHEFSKYNKKAKEAIRKTQPSIVTTETANPEKEDEAITEEPTIISFPTESARIKGRLRQFVANHTGKVAAAAATLTIAGLTFYGANQAKAESANNPQDLTLGNDQAIEQVIDTNDNLMKTFNGPKNGPTPKAKDAQSTPTPNTKGKSPSNPDGDGIDKPYPVKGTPAASQGDGHDGNNGGGNDPDKCDDNKGDDKRCNPKPTKTHEPHPSKTPAPTKTHEPEPTATPRPTKTHEPHPTKTHEPEPTATPRPTKTHEPHPSKTPEPTDTPRPTKTHEPTPTTPPTATKTPEATATPRPEDTATPTPQATNTPTRTPETTSTPTPRPVDTATPTPTPTEERRRRRTPTPTEEVTPSPTPVVETPTPRPTEPPVMVTQPPATETPVPPATPTPQPPKVVIPPGKEPLPRAGGGGMAGKDESSINIDNYQLVWIDSGEEVIHRFDSRYGQLQESKPLEI